MTDLKDINVDKGVFFEVENSRYIDWYMNESITILRYGAPPKKHYVLYLEDFVIEVLTDYDVIIRTGSVFLKYGLKPKE